MARRRWLILLIAAHTLQARLLEGLPGDEVKENPSVTVAPNSPIVKPAKSDSGKGVNWLMPSIDDQLARDQTLLTLGKGAVFLPSFCEPRREPEISVFGRGGKLITSGLVGHRILLDTGNFVLHFGSGPSGRRLKSSVHIEEGRTLVLPPAWGGLLVETLTPSGEYFNGQYEVLRMERWINYGRGFGYKEERLQDVKAWILSPGVYRISKAGEGYNSLSNYITVQINPGELHSIELIFASTDPKSDLIAGGAKSLNTHAQIGRHWTYGLRAGGNLALIREVNQTDLLRQSALFSTDLRTRARFELSNYIGLNEIFLQNSFLKEKGEPISATSDYLQFRSTWVRRLNAWLGPYIRGQATSHLFPSRLNLDTSTAYIVRNYTDTSGARRDTVGTDTSGSFRQEPSFFPFYLAEGIGVNLEWISGHALEISTQFGLAARQQISNGDYIARSANEFESAVSSRSLGAEGIINAKLRIATQFTLDLRAEIFAENASPAEIQLEKVEADFRFFLSRHIEIGYLFQISEILESVANRFPRQHSVSLRVSFNY